MAIIPSVPGNWGGEASPYGSYTTTGTVTGAAVTLSPPGWYWIKTGAHNTVQSTAVSGTTTVTLLPASTTGTVYSDGTSTIVNDSTGGTAANYAKILLDTA